MTPSSSAGTESVASVENTRHGVPTFRMTCVMLAGSVGSPQRAQPMPTRMATAIGARTGTRSAARDTTLSLRPGGRRGRAA